MKNHHYFHMPELILGAAINILFIVTINAQDRFDKYFISIPSSCGKASIMGAAAQVNPALTGGGRDSTTLSIGFSPSRFGLKELSPFMAGCGFRLSPEISAQGSLFGIGNELYNEFSANFASSIVLSEFLTAGGSVSLSRLGIKNYRTEYNYDITVGGIFNLGEDVSAGFAFTNITGSHYMGGERSVRRQALIGAGLRADQNLYIDADLVFNINYQSGFALAARYDLPEIIKMKLALLTNPRSLEAGVAVDVMENMSLGIDVYYHDVLGFSQSGGVEWGW